MMRLVRDLLPPDTRISSAGFHLLLEALATYGVERFVRASMAAAHAKRKTVDSPDLKLFDHMLAVGSGEAVSSGMCDLSFWRADRPCPPGGGPLQDGRASPGSPVRLAV